MNSRFPFRGGRGSLPDNDHEFRLAGDVELLRRSLRERSVIIYGRGDGMHALHIIPK